MSKWSHGSSCGGIACHVECVDEWHSHCLDISEWWNGLLWVLALYHIVYFTVSFPSLMCTFLPSTSPKTNDSSNGSCIHFPVYVYFPSKPPHSPIHFSLLTISSHFCVLLSHPPPLPLHFFSASPPLSFPFFSPASISFLHLAVVPFRTMF